RAIGVADDDVQAAVFAPVGVRLITGIEDGALRRSIDPDALFEEIGPLAELKPWLDASAGLLDPHLARAGKELACDEEGDHRAHDRLEWERSREEIVLVGAVAPAVVVGVILEHPP